VEEAQGEFLDAISYYEKVQRGLGLRFKNELDRCILWIAKQPEQYRIRPGAYRRVNLRGFPFYIAYIVRAETLWVLVVAHAKRKPLYWISRHNEIS
jgi:hypothetical protein